jgi:hypothetical protein
MAAVLRGLQAGESFWLDELHTSWTVSGSLSEVAERAALGNQSPLYFWLAWFCARLPLPPEIALRLPSLLAGCGLPVAVYWLAKKLQPSNEPTSDDTVPLLAAWLVVIDPLAIFYSQEARPYALLQLAVVFHLGLLLRILERSSWWPRAGWVVTGALIVHLHYTGGLILIAEFVALVALVLLSARQANNEPACDHQNNKLELCFSCWIDLGVLALLLLPAIPGMLEVAARRENWNQFVKPQPAIEILRMFSWTPAIIPLIVLFTWRKVTSQRNLLVLACWLLVPLGLAWVLTQAHVAALFHKRYLIAAWPASLVAAALCVRLGGNVATQSALVGIILAISVVNGGLVQNWLQDGRLLHDRREDWRTANRELILNMAHSESTLILLRSGLIEANQLPENKDPRFAAYCQFPLRGAYRIQDDVSVFPLTTNDAAQHLSAELRQVLRDKGTKSFWLVNRSSNPAARQQLLLDLQESIKGEEIWEPQPPQEFGNVYLQQILIRPSVSRRREPDVDGR